MRLRWWRAPAPPPCDHLDAGRVAWGLVAAAAAGTVLDGVAALDDVIPTLAPAGCDDCRRALVEQLTICAVALSSEARGTHGRVITQGVARSIALRLASR